MYKRQCQDCGAIYNIKFKPPKVAGVCDVCGGSELVQRADETLEAIDNRLKVYQQQTAPLTDFYREQGLLVSVASSDLEPVRAALNARKQSARL